VRTRHRASLLAALAALSALLLAAGAHGAALPAPADLRVFGGADAWHADNDLRLDWDLPAGAEEPAAVRYRVRDGAGAAVILGRAPWSSAVEHIHLPGPGGYWAEVWFENGTGEQGAAAGTQMRFDDRPPGMVRPLLPGGWVGAGQGPLLRLTHPAGPQPVSGVRGYAVSLDPAPSGSPCLLRNRCSETETDLRGGAGEDSMRLTLLPEGTVYVHAVAVSGAGVSSTTIGTGVLRIDVTPPTVAIAEVPPGWTNRAVTVTARASDGRSGMAAAGESGPITALAVDGGAPTFSTGASVSSSVSGEGVHEVSSFARDAAGNHGGGEAATVRIDRTPPRVAFASSLDPADPELLEARVSDPLSGPDPARGTIAIRPRGSHRQFAALPTAVNGERLLARWDSDRFQPGLYEFKATAHDAAGNVARSQRRANGAELVLPAPLKATTTLHSGFGGGRALRRRASRTIPYGRGATVGGTLTDAAGDPLANQSVQVVERFSSGVAATDRVHEVRTSGNGAFVTRLPAGASRQIEFSFAGTHTLAAARGRAASLAVRAGVHLRASAASAAVGGRPLVFSGAVADAAAIPASGKSVELQFRLPGLAWTQFRTVRTDERGRFRYPYRFSDDDSRGVRFQFRAFAPAEPGWPYEPGASRPLLVEGR
jgi:hypothetical protein